MARRRILSSRISICLGGKMENSTVSRIENICDSAMELAWLATLLLTPLFYNPFSFQPFDATKSLLLRSLALIAASALIVKKTDEYCRRARKHSKKPNETSWWRRPFALPLVAVAGTTLLSTSLSVAPSTSWWGSAYRMQGASALLCYLILFLSIQDGLRTKEQWRRLQATVLLTSFPVALGAILQHFNRSSPLLGIDKFSGRFGSTIGNPIFLGGYLIMVVPFTLEYLIHEIRSVKGEKRNKANILAAGSTGLILITQLTALVLTDSRGPWIGALVAGYLAILFFLVAKQGAKLDLRDLLPAFGTVALGLAIGGAGIWGFTRLSHGRVLPLLSAALAIFALFGFLYFKKHVRWLWLSWSLLPAAPAILFLFLAAFSNPIISNLSGKLPGTDYRGGTVEVRRVIWRGIVDHFKDNEPLVGYNDYKDALNPIRRFIGYGPESFSPIGLHHDRRELTELEGQETIPDRAHNESLDALATTGLLGAAANLLIYFALAFYAFSWLDFIGSGKDRKAFILISVSSIVLCIGFPCILGVPYLVGLGAAASLIVAVFGYCVYSGFRGSVHGGGPANPYGSTILLLLTALIAHFVEIHLGISTTVSRPYFYLFAAAMVLLGTRGLAEEGVGARFLQPQSGGKQPKAGAAKKPASAVPGLFRQRMLFYTLLIAVIMLVLDWNLISVRGESNALSIFWGTWSKFLNSNNELVTGIADGTIVILMLAIGFAISFKNSCTGVANQPSFNSGMPLFLGITLSVWAVYGIVKSLQIEGSSEGLPPQAASDFVVGLLNVFFMALVLMLAALWWSLWRSDVTAVNARPQSSKEASILGLLLLCGVFFLSHQLTLEPLRADMFFKLAIETNSNVSLAESLFLYRESVNAAAGKDFFQFYEAQALVESARITNDEQARWRSLDRAESLINGSLGRNPFSALFIRNLARYHTVHGELIDDMSARTNHLRKAVALYPQTSRLWPNQASFYREWGEAEFQLGDLESAQRQYLKAKSLDTANYEAYAALGDIAGARGDSEGALKNYEQACRLNPGEIKVQKQRLLLLKKLGRYDEAVASELDSTAKDLNNTTVLFQISKLFEELGDIRRALSYAQRVYALLPANQQPSFYPTVQGLQNRLKQ